MAIAPLNSLRAPKLVAASLALALVGFGVSMPGAAFADPAAAAATNTYTTVGTFSGTVPTGVCAVKVTVVGGAGGSAVDTVGSQNGAAASIVANYSVLPGQAYSGIVGGGGGIPSTDGTTVGIGGSSGSDKGGNGGTSGAVSGVRHPGAGGGGYSSLSIGSTLAVLAGGGGGSAGGHSVTTTGKGGNAGLPTGTGAFAGTTGNVGKDDPTTNTVNGGAGGGTAAAGAGGTNTGNASYNGSAGATRTGGNGGTDTNPDAGGGGGAGYFGAGGGASTVTYNQNAGAAQITGGGGGGGSSFVAATVPYANATTTPTGITSSASGLKTAAAKAAGDAGSVKLEWTSCGYDLAVSKTVSAATTPIGSTITWTIDVTNTTAVMTKGDTVTLNDTLPGTGTKTIQSITVSGGTNSTTLANGTFSCNVGAGATMPSALECSRPYQQVGGSVDGVRGLNIGEKITVVYTQVAAGSVGTTLTNTASVVDRVTGDSNDTSSASTTLGAALVAADAVNDEYSTPINTAKTLDEATQILNNDSGTGKAVTGVSATSTQGGSVTRTGGVITYTPATGFYGDDTFTYSISATGGSTDSATVTIHVTPIAPDAVNDTASTTSNSAVTITKASLLSNDTGTAISFTSAQSTSTQGGSISTTATGVVYTPASNFSGTDTFTYTITGANGVTDTATVTVTVNPVAINAVDDEYSTPINTAKQLNEATQILNNDTGTGKAVTSVQATSAHGGTVTRSGGVITYTPATDFYGDDTFEYTITGNAGTDTATVLIHVTPIAPDAVNDSGSTTSNTNVTLTKAFLLSNDTGTAIAFTSAQSSSTQGGSISTTATGVVYTPATDFSGVDTFTYTITGPGGTDTATVSITVTPVTINAVDDNYSTPINTAKQLNEATQILNNDTGTGKAVTSVQSISVHGGTVTRTGGVITYTPANGFYGDDSFDYTITGNSGTDTATVFITVTPIATDAVNDTATATTGVPKNITKSTGILNNDTGTDIAITTFDATSAHGGTITSDSTKFVYTSAAGFYGTDTFTYTISGPGGTDTATVTITVSPVTTDAVNDTAATTSNVAVEIDRATQILNNDTGTAIGISTFDTSSTQGGTVSQNSSGNFVYTPATDFSGTDTFTYTITGPGGTDTATVTVTVTPVAVDAVNDTASTTSGSPVDIVKATGILNNDSGTGIHITSFDAASANGGTITSTSTKFVYTPATDFYGTDTFTYTITGNAGTDTATVTVTVTPVAPDAKNDTKSTTSNTPVDFTTGSLLTNDLGTAISFTSAQGTSAHNGTISVSGSTVTYTPATDFYGTDTFEYTITGANGVTDTATVTITVTPVAPDAKNDTKATDSNTPVDFTTGSLLTNDLGTAIAFTSADSTSTEGGTIVVTGSTITYTPATDFYGTDTFEYTITGANGVTDTATVTVTVSPVAPVANDDTYAVLANTTSTIDSSLYILPNDVGTLIEVTSVDTTSAQGGTVSVNAAGNIVYTPATNFSGTDTFEYTITGPGGTDTATVTITVGPVVTDARDDVASTTSGVAVTIDRDDVILVNDIGTNISVLSVDTTSAHNGTITRNAAGDFIYTPADDFYGTDTFEYELTGDNGTDTATVTVTVTPVAPTAVDDEGDTTSNVAVTITKAALLSNDSGTAISFTSADTTSFQGGTVETTATGVKYTPATDFYGDDTFEYTITGANGVTDVATVTITVTPVAPDAKNDTAATTSNIPVTVLKSALLSNDLGTAISFTSAQTASAEGGIVETTATGVKYTPATDFYGTDTFEYTITGANGVTDTATVTVTVTPVAPDAKNDTKATSSNVPVSFTTGSLLTNDLGTAISFTSADATSAEGGTITVTGSTVTYTPATDFYGTDTFEYTITGANGVTDTATVTVTVSPVAPNAVNDSASTTSNVTKTIDLVDVILDNDSGTLIAVTSVDATSANGGTITRNGDGDFVYTPATDFSGTDTFEYTITGPGGTDSATVTVLVTPVTTKAVDDSATTKANTSVTIDRDDVVLDNDEGTAIHVSANDAVSTQGGTIALDSSGNFVYSPATDFSGIDTFEYTITGPGGTDTATVTITVVPVAIVDEATTTAGTPVDIEVVDTALGTDLEATDLTDGTHGTTAVNGDGEIVYTPTDPEFSGIDTFTYTVTDPDGNVSDPITVTVHIRPIAVIDVATTKAGTPVAIDVITDAHGTDVTPTNVSDGTHGTTAVNGDGEIVYTPTDPEFSGTDTFTYTVTDPDGNVSDPITVTVTVNPVAVIDEASTPSGTPVDIDVITAAHGTNVTPTNVSNGTHGTTTVNGDGEIVYTPTDPTFAGTDTFTYTVTDEDGNVSAPITVTITVVPDVTIANDDEAETVANAPITIDLDAVILANDSGTGIHVDSVDATSTQGGTITEDADGNFVYEPADGFSGIDTFEYTITGPGGTETATVTVTVHPIAIVDSASTTAGTPVAIDVVTTAIGTDVEATDVTDGTYGTTTVNADGEIVYTPTSAEFSGIDTFTYTVTDPDGIVSAPITVTVTIVPVAVLDEATTTAGTPVELDVVAAAHGTDLVVTDLTDGTHGTTAVNPAGDVVYSPTDPEFSGTDTFTYTVTDPDGNTSAPITVTVTVNPVAVLDAATTYAGEAVDIDAVAAAHGTDVAVTDLTDGSEGTTALDADGVIIYTPTDPDYSGKDTFTYTVTDDEGNVSAPITVTVTILPVAVDDHYETPFNTAIEIDLDEIIGTDHGTDLTLDALGDGTTLAAPTNGTVALNGAGNPVFTPTTGFSGIGSFTYNVLDADGESAWATVYIVIVPDAPDDLGFTVVNEPVSIDVLDNDSGTDVEIDSFTQAAHGEVVETGGELVYTPDTDWSGIDTFTYKAKDSFGSIVEATVTVQVSPTASNDSATTSVKTPVTFAVIGNDKGTDLTVTIPTTPHGTFVVNADKTVTFSPANGYSGVFTLAYTVTDPDGLTATASITITVNPKATADTWVVKSGEPTIIDPLANDDGSTLTVTGTTPPSHGTLTTNPDGTFTYTPNKGFVGVDTFTYTVTDADGLTSTTTVTIVVAPAALAITGADPATAVGVALGLLILGGGFMLLGKRRKRRTEEDANA